MLDEELCCILVSYVSSDVCLVGLQFGHGSGFPFPFSYWPRYSQGLGQPPFQLQVCPPSLLTVCACNIGITLMIGVVELSDIIIVFVTTIS